MDFVVGCGQNMLKLSLDVMVWYSNDTTDVIAERAQGNIPALGGWGLRAAQIWG